MEEKLILAVTEHRFFGWKLNIYSARVNPDGSIFILGIPSMEEELRKGASSVDIALIRAAEELSDQSLLKAYSKEKSVSLIPQHTIDNLIRPRIESNICKMTDLALQTSIPVYFREKIRNKTLYEQDLIQLLPVPSHCLFNFVKDESGLRYFISLTNQYEEISLQQEPVVILSQEPCIILLGNAIHRVENIESKKLTPFFTKTHIEVPASSEKAYIQNFVLKTIPNYDVRIEGLEMKYRSPHKQAVLVLEENVRREFVFSLFFQYDNQRFNPAQKRKKIVGLEESDGSETICWFDRDLDWESQCIHRLSRMGLRQEGDNHFYPKQHTETQQQYGLINWINLHIDKLRDFHIEQHTDRTYYQGKFSVQSNLDLKIDWFDMEIEVVFDHFRIGFNRFRKHILTGNSEFVLPDGSVFILPEQWFHQYHDFFLHGKDTEKGIRIKKIHVGILDDTEKNFFSANDRKKWIEFNKKPEKPALPSGRLNQLLRPYQKEGFYWLDQLYKRKWGGCLADDMGLGKTLQTITLLESIYSQAEKRVRQLPVNGQLSLFAEQESVVPASLVVAPTSLLHNWKNELKKFTPELKAFIYAGNKRLRTKDIAKIFKHYHIIITSYGLIRSDIEYLENYSFHFIILDESQFIKNPESILYQAVKRLHSSNKIVLTGTPIENSLSDLWAQFNFINPGLLGNYSFFKNYYIQKIIKEKNESVETSLQKIIRPFLLRRTKEEVEPELPSLSQEIVYCDLSEKQEEVYQKEKNSIRNLLLENKENSLKNNFTALQSLMKLRLLSNHPALTHPTYDGDSGKFNQILLYFESAKKNGHKVLIFSSFVKHLKLLAEKFNVEGWKYSMLTGQTINRAAEIDKFNRDKDINCFFISLKAGGTGLNLTAADYVFIIDPWWNPAAEMQALSRAHRIGQEKKVMAYRFISSGTVEEKIIRLQEMKTRLSETFITSNNPLDYLEDNEIKELFE